MCKRKAGCPASTHGVTVFDFRLHNGHHTLFPAHVKRPPPPHLRAGPCFGIVAGMDTTESVAPVASKPRMVLVNVRIPNELYDDLCERAAQRTGGTRYERSLTAVIVDVLREGLRDA